MNIFNLIRDIENFDPEVHGRLDSRRDLFKKAGNFGLKMAAASVPIALGTMFQKVYGKGDDLITDTLNFALTLEYLEDEFYVKGLTASGLIPTDRRVIFQQISKHESVHVTFLKSAITSLGATPVNKPTFDFTGGKGQ
ncbi:MAG: ferritin-like domain-containing protein, partial [Verrucomicrobia bacterium]|nr:ferritin-like domain-containing protein [Cytophagales bacterium]